MKNMGKWKIEDGWINLENNSKETKLVLSINCKKIVSY